MRTFVNSSLIYADLIAVRDTGQHSADRLDTLSMNDVELVMIGGIVQLVSEDILERLPLFRGLGSSRRRQGAARAARLGDRADQ